MAENKQGVVLLMTKARKELGRASYRAIARQLARNVGLAKSLRFLDVRGGVDRVRTARIDGFSLNRGGDSAQYSVSESS